MLLLEGLGSDENIAPRRLLLVDLVLRCLDLILLLHLQLLLDVLDLLSIGLRQGIGSTIIELLDRFWRGEVLLLL